MVTILNTNDARLVLASHPDIRAESIPSHGIAIVDDTLTGEDRDYLIGIVGSTGEVKVIDITAYDEAGNRIPPWRPFLQRAAEEVIESVLPIETARELNAGVAETWNVFWEKVGQAAPTVNLALGAVIMVGVIWLVRQFKGPRTA